MRLCEWSLCRDCSVTFEVSRRLEVSSCLDTSVVENDPSVSDISFPEYDRILGSIVRSRVELLSISSCLDEMSICVESFLEAISLETSCVEVRDRSGEIEVGGRSVELTGMIERSRSISGLDVSIGSEPDRLGTGVLALGWSTSPEEEELLCRDDGLFKEPLSCCLDGDMRSLGFFAGRFGS